MTSEIFASAVKKSVSRDLSVGDLLAAVDSLAKAKECALVAELYKIWLKHNGDHPLGYAVNFNLGVVLADANDLVGAKEALSAAINSNPDFMPAYINLGNILERLGVPDQAIAQWSKVADHTGPVTAEALKHKTTALKQIGRVFEVSKLEASAEEVLKRSLEIDINQRDVVQHWIALRQSQCKWPLVPTGFHAESKELLRSISPLSAAVLSNDPIFQFSNSHNYNRKDVAPQALPATDAAALRGKLPKDRLRVGYLSSDLREHAVGFLMSEVFELHDRSSVETFAYYCGIPSSDSTHNRFKASAGHWRDITTMTDEAAAAAIRADGIDILVDLNGYTKDARLKVVAKKPAPIIVNWLGFPGTMASPYHHYIIADPVIIPKGHEKYYSEKVMRLPCYQPNDRKRGVADRIPSREEAGLPADAVVYCCFNGTQKITKPVFDSWMEILRRAVKGVLWLLSGTTDTNDRLRSYAEAAGISRDRLIFAPRKSNPDHLARYSLADVFLDTFPYGAHTTASDALWMGVPVITVPGSTFASRVCASLVSAAGLEDLVCPDWESYIEKAASLSKESGRAELRALKARLTSTRDTCALFDTPGLVRHLEQLYGQMWLDHSSGSLPVPDLSNLDLLHDIGCAIDHEATQSQVSDDVGGIYRQRCVDRHAFATLHDPKLSAGAKVLTMPSVPGQAKNAGPLIARTA